MRKFALHLICAVVLLTASFAEAAGKAKHIVVVVWDGMRPDFISQEHTPTLYQLAQGGVMFRRHHSVYCTATEVNGTAIATGAYPAHSGIIANRDYRPELNALKSIATESLGNIRRADELSQGHYLARLTTAEILQNAGLHTAVAGAKDVALLADRNERPSDAPKGLTLFAGKTLPPSLRERVVDSLGRFPRAADSKSLLPNAARDEWTTRALLNQLWTNGVPAFSLLWLSEPDFSQHAAGPGSLKALAAVESSDQNLAAVLKELDRRGLRDQTDVFVVSDHGFSTVEHKVDVCSELQKAGFAAQREFKQEPQNGEILVVGQGGSVLFYVIGHDAAVSRKLVEFLQQQPFSGVIFSREPMEGTFTLAQANLNSAHAPDVAVSLRWSEQKSDTGAPGLYYCDGGRKPGEGSHASLSRFDLRNILVGAGPDLKQGFADDLPTGNTDLAPTILWLFGVKQPESMDGRVLSEALVTDAPPAGQSTTRRLEANRKIGESVWHQYLQISQVNDTIYFDEGNGHLAEP